MVVDSYERIDLAALLRAYAPPDCKEAGPKREAGTSNSDLDKAFETFRDRAECDPVAAAMARNALQERMITASNLRCAIYQVMLRTQFSKIVITPQAENLFSIASGTLGATAHGPAAQAWSGAAAVLSITWLDDNAYELKSQEA